MCFSFEKKLFFGSGKTSDFEVLRLGSHLSEQKFQCAFYSRNLFTALRVLKNYYVWQIEY